MEKAKSDRTYCYGINCNKYNTCSRYVGKYDFKEGVFISFMFNCNNTLYEKEGV